MRATGFETAVRGREDTTTRREFEWGHPPVYGRPSHLWSGGLIRIIAPEVMRVACRDNPASPTGLSMRNAVCEI